MKFFSLVLCQFTVDFFKDICNHFGVPIALDKSTVLNTTIFFLGIEFDTIHASCGSPKTNYTHWDKLFDSCRMPKKSLHLISLLNFACKTVAPGRIFCRRLIDATIGIKRPHHFIRVNRGMWEDLAIWQILDQYNGVTVISSGIWTSVNSFQLFTDSAGWPLGEGGGSGYSSPAAGLMTGGLNTGFRPISYGTWLS